MLAESQFGEYIGPYDVSQRTQVDQLIQYFGMDGIDETHSSTWL